MQRIRLVLTGLVLGFLLIQIRLFYWQILKGNARASAASQQYYFTLQIPPIRGTILASDANPLVTHKTAYFAYGEPKKIEDPKSFISGVSELLGLDKEKVEENISVPNSVWVPLKPKVDEETYQKIIDLKLQGIGFEKDASRYYPEGSMAANLLGFVGSDSNGEDKGYFGIEGFYNLALRGKPGSLIQEKDARGLPILLGDGKRIPAENGQTLELYLDRTVQFIAETKLKQGIQKYGAKEGLVAIMDPKTGGFLGAAAWPAFDPRDFGEYPSDLYPNPLVADTFEPGSTFKVLVMAAALNEKVIEPSTKYNEEGPVSVGPYFIKTWNNEYHGEMTATQIIEKSSNPGMVFVQKKLGKDKFLDYIKKYGFGEKTGIDLEEETTSQIRNDDEWKEIDLATASFGQGIAVTPIQMLRAVSVLANDGVLVEPHVVHKFIDTKGKVVEIKPKDSAKVIRPAAAKTITEMMINAVDNGEAKWAKPKGYRIAGKTGTAQIPVEGHYDDKKTIASFVGFAPADDPKFVMLVLLREPTSSPWGSETAAPLFFNIAKELFSYYGISPKD